MKKVKTITCLIIGAWLLAASDFVQSSYSGTYITLPGGGIQRFRDVQRDGSVVNYEFVPSSLSSAPRVKRQVKPVEEKISKPSENNSSKNNKTISSETLQSSNVSLPVLSTSLLTSTVPTLVVAEVQTNASSPSTSSPPVASSLAPRMVSVNNTNTKDNATIPFNESLFDKQLDSDFPNYPFFTTPATINETQNEVHKYYNSTTVQKGLVYWENLDNYVDAQEHDVLSSAHRRAATLKLKFAFPFYGHDIENITIATGGFVYLGEHVHAWLAATQYVAPLMANFDSSLSDNSSVRYVSSANQFTVEWRNVHLKDTPEKGPFTFQTSLYKNGTIVFVYKNLPLTITSINDQAHPVKVGLSDAYIREKHILFVKQKTIYEYDRVDLKNQFIDNGTAIVFTPQPTCLNFKTCGECVGHNTTFDCSWCSASKRCSDGTDRYRDEWISQSCERSNVTTNESCSTGSTNTYIVENNSVQSSQANLKVGPGSDGVDKSAMHQHSEDGMSAGSVVGILFLVMLVLVGAGWIFYGYVFPHSTSGQLLIRYRPSQWRFRRGEARYTAASIHM